MNSLRTRNRAVSVRVEPDIALGRHELVSRVARASRRHSRSPASYRDPRPILTGDGEVVWAIAVRC